MNENNRNDRPVVLAKRVFQIEGSFERNVFVMMRYRGEKYYNQIELAIRSSLEENGLNAHLAKDSAIHDSLWENTRTYMDNCNYGVAVFEDIDVREYNPNISIELGYMLGQGKRCLLLKEQRMPNLPTDMYGHIYKSFDKFNIEQSIKSQVDSWVKYDLGILHASDVSAIFRSSLPDDKAKQQIFIFLYRTKGNVTSHMIEDYVYPGSGDEATPINRFLLSLRSKKLIEYVNNAPTLGYYFLSEEIRRLLEIFFSQREDDNTA